MTGLLAGASVLAAAWLGWPGVLIGSLLTVLWMQVSGSRRDAVPALAAILVLSSAMAVRASPGQQAAPLSWAIGTRAIRGEVVSSPSRGASFDTFTLAATEAEWEDQWTAVTGRVCVVGPQSPVVALGDRVWLRGEPVSITDESQDIRGMLNARGCGASVFARVVAIDATGSGWLRAVATYRDRFSMTIRSLSPGDSGALMSGLVTGADDALSRKRKDAFLATGTTHITAVSGSNFSTLVTVLLAAGSVAGVRRNRIWLGLAIIGVWAYAVFVGLEAPALRAAIAASAAIIALRAGRRPDLVTLNVLAAAAMALVVPELVWALGFQLSLVASVALAASATVEEGDGPGAVVASALWATGIAQIATLPLLLPLRGELPLVSLPANLAIGPLVALAFPLSAAAGLAGSIWTPAGGAVALPAELAANGILASNDWFASIGGTIRVGAVHGLVAMIIAAAALCACLSVTEGGQRLWRQWPDRMARMGAGGQAVFVGLLAGTAVALIAALVVYR